MKVKVQYVDSSVLGRCPASVDMSTGVVSINRSVWDRYDDFEKSFVIMHELGHYLLDTDSEYEADEYALRKVYKTAPRSLKRSLQTLCKIRVIDPRRLDNLYRVALDLDAKDGNDVAAIELERINNFNNNKNFRTMTKARGQETYPEKRNIDPNIRVIRRADGDKSHGTNGIRLGGWYFSVTNILLAAILVVMLFKK